MSVRQVATKSLGKQIPDNNNNSKHSISSSISANSQQKNYSGVSYNKLINTNSKKQAASRGVTFRSGNGHHLDQQQREQQLQRGEVSPERLNKSREAVKAWLESSSSPEQLDIVAQATAAANELLQGRRSFSSSSGSFEEGSGCTNLPNSVTVTSSRDDPSTTLRSSGRVIKQLRSRDISPPKAAARAHTPNSQPAKSDVYQLHSGERYRPPTTTPALSTRRIHHLRDVSEQEGLPAGSSSVTGSDYSLGAEWRAILAAAAQAVDPAAPRLHNHQQLIAAAAAAAAAVDGDGIHSEHSNYYSICAGDEDQEEAVSEAHTVEEFVSCTEHQNSPQLMFLKPPRTMKSKNHLLHHHHQPDVASVLVPRELQEDRKSSEEEMKQQLIRPPDDHVVTLVPQQPPLVATAHAIKATVPNNMTRNNTYTSHEAQQKLEENLEGIPITITTNTNTNTNITTVAPKLKVYDNNGGGGGGGGSGLPPRSSKVVAEELTPMQLVLLQVKQHKVESKAAAWERAKCSKLSNRYCYYYYYFIDIEIAIFFFFKFFLKNYLRFKMY